MEYAQNRDAGAKAVGDVYEPGNDRGGNVEANLGCSSQPLKKKITSWVK